MPMRRLSTSRNSQTIAMLTGVVTITSDGDVVFGNRRHVEEPPVTVGNQVN